ncbi:MAG: 30S ribosomal protein S16 [Candidatus Gracilibacteria bacterium]|nr:30S ribosomal protein S16 [Candidatus Gracilibacteria bacterium]
MLIIRLSRTGRKNLPAYNIVVTEKTHAANSGRSHEKLGFYDALKDPVILKYDKERVQHWIKQGAQVSETAARLFHKDGVEGMDKFVNFKMKYNKKSKNPEAEPEEAPAAAEGEDSEAPAAEVSEEKKEEAPAETPAE